MTEAADFIFKEKIFLVDAATYTWSAPSNIALVKYWGKKDNQEPANPSVSFTLKKCKTTTTLQVEKKSLTTDFSFDFLFEGKPKPDFKPKIELFLNRIAIYCPYLKNYHLIIDSTNTFPHSSGIASSASGMAALAMTIMSLEKALFPEMEADFFYKKASFLARLGSGSACRSIKGKVVNWGFHKDISGSNDLFGKTLETDIHPIFQDYQDAILLVDKGEKQVSSSVGHNLMHQHPFAEQRFLQAHNNITSLLEVLKTGDLETFMAIVESEAMTLHAMMMTSMPYFILMKPHTLEIINTVWNFRKSTQIPLCFTLDAGANVHLLYPKEHSNAIIQFIDNKLVGFCEKGHYICDEIGDGAIAITNV
jgi:diphosphomevalonate decarboxylase